MTNTDNARTLDTLPTSQLLDTFLDAVITWYEAPAIRQPLDDPANTPRFAGIEWMRLVQDEIERRIRACPDDLHPNNDL